MLYYQVAPTADQKQIGIRTKTGFLIANELYTEAEINKAYKNGRINNFMLNSLFKEVTVSRNNTYWFFGARFKSVSN